MARDDVAHKGAWIQRKNTQQVCRRNKKKEEVEQHRTQSHDAHRRCTLPIKRRCARISNIEITNMKGGRICNSKIEREREMIPKRLPVRSPKINKKITM